MLSEPKNGTWTGKAVVVILVAASVSLAGVGGVTATQPQSDATAGSTAPVTSSVAASTDSSTATRSVSSTTVSAGGSVTVTLTATGADSNANIEESFDPAVAGATVQEVTVDGNAIDPLLDEGDSTGALVTIASSVNAGAPIEVTYTLSIPESATPGTNVTITGELTGTEETSVDPTVLTVRENTPPEADAGSNLSVEAGDSVTLTAAGSSDADGDALTYSWTQTGGPSVTLSDTSATTPSFSAPSVTSSKNLTFEVTAADGNGGTDTDTVRVTVSPAASTDGGPERSVPSTITPGGSVTVTLTANATGDGASFQESFSPAFASASPETVTVGGQSVSPVLNTADANGAVVTLSSASGGAKIVAKYTVTAPDNASVGDVYAIDGTVTLDRDYSLDTDQITVEEQQSLTARYDEDGDGIDIMDLGNAAADYASGTLSITELGRIAAAYANG